MYKKMFLIVVCIAGYILNAYPQYSVAVHDSATSGKDKHGAMDITDRRSILITPVIPDEIIKEFASTPIINIMDIAFANIDSMGNIINNFGSNIYKKETMFITARIKYRGLSEKKENILMKVRIVSENGIIKSGLTSKDGFSFENAFVLSPGIHYHTFSGWGRQCEGGSYESGVYTYEIWHNSKKIYSKPFIILPDKP